MWYSTAIVFVELVIWTLITGRGSAAASHAGLLGRSRAARAQRFVGIAVLSALTVRLALGVELATPYAWPVFAAEAATAMWLARSTRRTAAMALRDKGGVAP